MTLRQSDIPKFQYRGGWDVHWDDKVPGLGVRVYPSGKKAFVLSYRGDGRKRLMVLGRFGADLTLEQARDTARKHRVGIKEGVDPPSEGFGRHIDEVFDLVLRHEVVQMRVGGHDGGQGQRRGNTHTRQLSAGAPGPLEPNAPRRDCSEP